MLLRFSVFSPPSSPLIIIVSIINIPYFSTEIAVQCDGCLGWGWVWLVGLMPGLQVGQAFGVLLLPGLGVGGSSS